MAATTRAAKRGLAKRGKELSAAVDNARPAAGSSEEIRALARAAAVAAIARLRALSNSDDERVALAATQELLNRAFGKVAAGGGDEQANAAQPPLVIKIVRFGGDDDAAATVAAKSSEVA